MARRPAPSPARKRKAAAPRRRTAAKVPAAEVPAADVPAGDVGAFVAAWPGPAAALGIDGALLAVNGHAPPLLSELAGRAAGGLAALVRAACADGVARTDTVVTPAKPTPLTFDVCVAPLLARGHAAGALILARDVSLAANLRTALTESRQRFKDLVEISSDFAWETDASGAFTFVSPQGALGWPADDLLGRSIGSFLAEGSIDDPNRTPFSARNAVSQVELWLKRKGGASACVSVSATPLRGADGAWRGARGVWRDVTEFHENAQALADSEARERMVGYITRTIRDEVEPDAMLRAASAAAAKALSAAACRIWDVGREANLTPAAEFGAPTVERVDAHMAAHVRRLQDGGDAPAPDRNDQLEIAGPNGRFLGAVTRFHRAINGAVGLWRAAGDPDWSQLDRDVIAMIADQIGIAQEQIANHEALAKQARTDGLTGLLNRRGFTRQIEREIAECDRLGKPGALVYVDLDNFKAVNDRRGHPAGDAALKALADSLRKAVRAGDLVARLGGDEFALWLASTERDAAIERATEILAIKNDIASYSAGDDKPLGLSIGVAVHQPTQPETIAELLARADQAMYEVKKRGKGSYAVAPDAASFRAAAPEAHA